VERFPAKHIALGEGITTRILQTPPKPFLVARHTTIIQLIGISDSLFSSESPVITSIKIGLIIHMEKSPWTPEANAEFRFLKP
jgi:hypothetical protein